MNHMDAEGVSNDETTIISELLNSAEALQSSVNLNQIQLQRKDDPISLQNNNNESNIITLPLTECNNVKLPTDDTGNGEVIHNIQCGDIGDVSKLQHIRHVHIPYILNGELYQIQTQDGENVTVKCCHCPPDRVYRGSVRSTGNFHMHIKRRHPDLLEKLHDMKVNALLERRDRLMRNRKMIHRSNRNRPAAIVDPTVSAGCVFKSEDKANAMAKTTDSQNQLDSTSELSLMHTHKLKIKTVFQRHQMQQREAELRNWNNNGPYANTPIEKLSDENVDQPINYSLKSQENNETHTHMPSYQHPQHMQRQEQNILPTCGNTLTNLNKQTTVLKNSSTGKTDNTRNLSISTSSISISCPSVMSSFSSNHQYDLDTQLQCSDIPEKHGHLAIVKPEHLLATDSKAIDLSIHTDSGIFSNSDDDDGGIRQNNDTQSNGNNKTSKSRADSRLANSATNTDGGCNDGCNNSNKKNTCNNSLKWQELLMQVENSLRDIQREMNVRNQIESNRMFLDIAKFKFLHPGFQFNF